MRKVEDIEPMVRLITIGPAAKIVGVHRNTLERRLETLGDRAPQPQPHVGIVRKWVENEIRLLAVYGPDWWKVARDEGEQAAKDQMAITRPAKRVKRETPHRNGGGAADLF